MLNLPWIIADLLNSFAPCFYGVTTWAKARVLLLGVILTPGKRVVTETVWVMGLSNSEGFAQYHHVLNRAVWSPLELAQTLLKLLVKTFAPQEGALVFGIDPTIERRWGRKIAARGIYHDPVRSSHSHFVKVSGLRWISLMLLTRTGLPAVPVRVARRRTNGGRVPAIVSRQARPSNESAQNPVWCVVRSLLPLASLPAVARA